MAAVPGKSEAPLFTKPEEEKVAQIAYEAIRLLENQPQKLPTAAYLTRPDIRAALVHEVLAQYRPTQLTMGAIVEPPDIAGIVAVPLGMVVNNHKYSGTVATCFEEQRGGGRTVNSAAGGDKNFFTFY